jgi:hypothetical protein
MHPLGKSCCLLKICVQKWCALFQIIAIYGPMIYPAPYVMLLMQADTLRGQVGGVLGPGNQDFLGPVKRHRAIRQVPFGAPKRLRFSGPNSLPFAQKQYVQGCINQRSIGSFMYMSFCILCSVFCILYFVFCILYSVFCILYSVFCVLCSVCCLL